MMKSGIQKKYLIHMVILLLLALLLSSFGVWIYVRGSMTEALIDKHEFMTEKMGLSLDNLYQKSDEVTAECIFNDNIQESLKARPLDELARSTLSKYFTYIDLDQVADYCYVDNKNHVYTRFYSTISYADFEKSGLEKYLDGTYAETRWFWAKDTLFGSGQDALFIGRYVRSMEYAHEPGMLFFKMSESFLERGIGGRNSISEGCVAGILDSSGQICALWSPKGYEMPDQSLDSIRKLLPAGDSTGMIWEGKRTPEGVLSVYRQAAGGLLIFTFVPDIVLNSGAGRIILVLSGIYLFVVAAAAALSLYFSRRFTRPIQMITETMTGFDGQDFSRMIELHTHTELDQIGQSYNEMLSNIEKLLSEIKEQEKSLRTSELNMLISQINPHFLYNTLDTIYMLARMHREEAAMQMIQALSKYLRLSLSKGCDIVTVEDELENVRNYLEIQHIRNERLFQYEIICRVDASQTYVLKLILQPLVENAFKYGFCSIFEGGVIRIEVYSEDTDVVFCVRNNGTPIRTEMAERLNRLADMPFSQMKKVFPDKTHGYGTVNIVTRLRLKYGNGIHFFCHAQEDGTECVIRIPEERMVVHEE